MTISSRFYRYFAFVIVSNLFPATSSAQTSQSISSISPTEAVAGKPLIVQAQLYEIADISRMYFRYRAFTSAEFITLEMDLVGPTATVRIPVDEVLPPFIEYYIIIANQDGTFDTSPPGETPDPFAIPPGATGQIQIRQADQQFGVLLLSPDDFDPLNPADVIFAASLLRVDSTINKGSTQLWLDGVDVTDKAVISGDMLVFVPSNVGIELSGGRHLVTVRLFDMDGVLVEKAVFEFYVTGVGVGGRPMATRRGFTGSAQVESRHESVSDVGTWYNRGEIRFKGQLDEWAIVANAFVTSDEKSNRQPQNRFYGGIESSWLEAGFGDSFPIYPGLIMNGKRLRGFTGKARFGPQIFMVSAGETNKGLDGDLLQLIPIDSLAVEQQRDPTAAYAPIDATTWGKFEFGTYQRDLIVLRTETRLGRTGGIGISLLHGIDDTSSITIGSRPMENLVVGMDFGGSFDSRRIEFSGEAAFSAFNTDISSGNFTDEYIDTVFSNPSEVKRVRDILSDFITVNDNLRPLSFKELSTLAYEFSVGLNYFHNAFKAKYLFRGSDFVSFGQTFLRTDIQGYSLSDRISMSSNQILISVGFEHLQDNTSNFKASTTTFINLNAALSFFPRADAPSITVGYGRFSSRNGISTTGPDSLLSRDDTDDRAYLQSSYNFTLEAEHTTTVNLATSTRNDNSPRKLDVDNTTAAVRIHSRYQIPLRTVIDLSFSFNTLPGSPGGSTQQNDYSTLSFSGIYDILDQLSVEARISPTIGDVKRTIWDGSVIYNLMQGLRFQMRFTYFQNKNIVDDSIWRTTLRYDL